jgi:hypothetical protein
MLRALAIASFTALSVLPSGLPAAIGAEARMAVDPALAAAGDPLRVTGAKPRRWDKPIAFGPYRTGTVSDRGTLGWSVEILRLGVGGSKRPYAFTLQAPGGPVDAECHEKGLEAWHNSGFSVDLRAAAGKPALVCAFRLAAGSDGTRATWILELAAARKITGGFVGVLRPAAASAAGALAIRSLHALEGTPIPLGSPAGYALERDGRAAAAVETINAGRVWLPGTAAAEPAAVPAAIAALLLFEPPE